MRLDHKWFFEKKGGTIPSGIGIIGKFICWLLAITISCSFSVSLQNNKLKHDEKNTQTFPQVQI